MCDDYAELGIKGTFPTLASNKGATRNIIKAVLGQSSSKTTDGYIGADADTMREQMKEVTIKEDVSKNSGDNKEITPGLVKGE